jgi:VWFA-related protein
MAAATLLRSRFLLANALLVCAAANLPGQSIAPPIISGNPDEARTKTKDLIFKTSVRRVIVDVVVSDSFGRPVSGLKADDFAVKEDGQPQKVRSFDVHDFDPLSDSLPKLPAALPANTFVNVPAGPERGPLYVLLLDLLNMEISDQPTARKQLLEFIRNKPDGTRFAIFVLSDRLYQVQGFTEDRKVLVEAVDPKNPHSRIPKIFLYADNYRPYISTPGVFAQIGNYLADLPGRKNLIWFSGSFPSAIVASSDPNIEALNVDDQIKEATDSLTRGRVAVYPVDVRGVVAMSPMASDSAPPGNGAGMAAAAMLNATYMTEEEIARSTGGRAFHTTNDLASALTAATETGGRYYTLTYSPSNQDYDGKLRHIQIEVLRKGCRLEYRRSYYGNADPRKTEAVKEKRFSAELAPLGLDKPSDSLFPNMQHGAPIAHQLLFRAHIHTLSAGAKATHEQMTKLADQADAAGERAKAAEAKHTRPSKLQTYQIDYTIAARYPLLEIAAAAYDDDGKILNSAIQRVMEEREKFPEAPKGGAIYRVRQQFDVPVNAATVRVAVRDVATDNVGALEIKLPLAPDGAATSTAEHPAEPGTKSEDPEKP